jgi:hypothetical protein
MSLEISFTVCEDSTCKSLSFIDTTGEYSVNNPSGWGSPNSSISGATARLIIESDGSIFTLPMLGFPTIDTTKIFKINSSDIGYSSEELIRDQILSISYEITLNDSTILTQNIELALYGQTECCVSSMFLNIDVGCNDCVKSLEDNALKAYLILQGLKFSAECGNTTIFNKTLTYLNKLCSYTECSNCK